MGLLVKLGVWAENLWDFYTGRSRHANFRCLVSYLGLNEKHVLVDLGVVLEELELVGVSPGVLLCHVEKTSARRADELDEDAGGFFRFGGHSGMSLGTH